MNILNAFGLLAAALVMFVSPAFAADEFGLRFTQQPPAGLSDSVAQANQDAADAAAMQNIEPAAGEAAAAPGNADPEALSDEEEGDAAPGDLVGPSNTATPENTHQY